MEYPRKANNYAKNAMILRVVWSIEEPTTLKRRLNALDSEDLWSGTARESENARLSVVNSLGPRVFCFWTLR